MGACQSYRLPNCRTNTKKTPFFKIQSFFSSLDNKQQSYHKARNSRKLFMFLLGLFVTSILLLILLFVVVFLLLCVK